MISSIYKLLVMKELLLTAMLKVNDADDADAGDVGWLVVDRE